jgi:heat shock protein HslJ
MKFKIVLLIIATIFLSCKSDKNRQQIEVKSIAPATYFGIIPCADCEGVEMQVNLLTDLTFIIKQVALGKKRSAHISTGTWEFSDSTKAITLKSINQSPKKFLLREYEIMEMLDIHGKEIESKHNSTLMKTKLFEHITDAFVMKGIFTYMADAAIFVDCSSQKRYPVAMEGKYIDLERKYLASINAGSPLLVTLEGRLVLRPKMEGEGESVMLVVEKLNKVWPQMDCKSSLSTATLKNTYWKLVELNGKPVKVDTKEREVHFILKADGKSVKGFGGCNNFMGSFEAGKSKIKFGPMAGTMQFCKNTMELETSFMKALAEANNYKIFGETLALYRDGNVIAKLESVYF